MVSLETGAYVSTPYVHKGLHDQGFRIVLALQFAGSQYSPEYSVTDDLSTLSPAGMCFEYTSP